MESREYPISLTPSSEIIEEIKFYDFELCWRNLNYSVTNSLTTRLLRKLEGLPTVPKIQSILRDSNGIVRSGQLTAFMGPSGCGKSSLLECIVGKRMKGKTGEIFITGEDVTKEDITISFVAQENDFFKQLTVRETILFATKIQIATKYKDGNLNPLFDAQGKMIFTKLGGNDYCSEITHRVIEELGLENCANNRVSGCSGGQLKRLAIAQVLIAKPRLLVLDEPTTGLDSVSCLQVINILRNLTQQKPSIAVLATIHQPSQKVLHLFDKIYMFDEKGNFIFDSSPTVIAPYLQKFGSECPPQFNPADFLIEIACGQHNVDLCDRLSTVQKERFNNEYHKERYSSIPISDLERNMSFPSVSHIWNLVKRNLLITIRDPVVFGIRLLSTIGIVIYMVDLFGTSIGVRGGCPPDFHADFEPQQLDKIADETEDEMDTLFNNTGNMLMSILFVVFSAMMPTSVSFPNEMHVFKTEFKNKWYGIWSFFVGKSLAEIPFHLLMNTIHIPTMYWLQSQAPEMWRMMSVYFIVLLLQLNAQTMGYITGAIFMNNVPAAVFLAPNFWFIPFLLVCGLFIKIKSMSPFFIYFSNLSIFRFGFEGILVAIYGFNRCGTAASRKLIEGKEAFIVWMSAMLGIYGDGSESISNVTESVPSEKFVEEMIEIMAGDFTSKNDEVRSASMNIYDYENWFLGRCFLSLILFLFVLRLLALLCITFRVKSE